MYRRFIRPSKPAPRKSVAGSLPERVQERNVHLNHI